MHALLFAIVSAREYLAEVEKECFDEDMDLPLLLTEQIVCNIEYNMQRLAERQHIADKTKDLVEYLRKAEVDYTLLMYLQLQEETTKGKGFISYLQGICEQFHIPYNNRFFFDVVWAIFKKAGVSPITPTKFLMNRTKEEILLEYQNVRMRNEWGQHNPFFFQTFITTRTAKGFQKLVYCIARTWQDGVIRLLDILVTGAFSHGTRMFDAHGVFEHFVDDDTMACLMLDSEILASAFQGRKSAEDVGKELLQFPSVIATEMVAKGLLHEEDVLHVTVKDKTRPRGHGDTKISFHFLLGICARKGQQKLVIELCHRDTKEQVAAAIEQYKRSGALPEDCALQSGWYASDTKAAISNGFTTPFTLKQRSDPHSRKHSEQVICAGVKICETLCPIAVQDLCGSHLTEKERLWLLLEQLYTVPKCYMLSYATQLGAADKQKKGVAKPTPDPHRADSVDGRSAELHLPAWLMSALKSVSGRDVGVYTSPSSLECKRSTLPKPSQSRARLYQVPQSWCAGSMVQEKGHIHTSNCTVVAVDDELGVVYMTCVTGAPGHRITHSDGCVKVVNMHSALGEDGKVRPVEQVKGRCIHWAMFDEEDMNLLIKKVKASNKEEPKTKKPKT